MSRSTSAILGAASLAEIYQVKYVHIAEASDSLGRTGDYPDPLWPLENGDSVSLTAGENTAFWFSLWVPKTAPAGDYTTDVQIGGVSIPVSCTSLTSPSPTNYMSSRR